MNLNLDSEIPIYLQIAEQLQDAVFTGIYSQNTQIPSTTELSISLKINPATVLKGMNILVDENIIYKKRGLGMFVSEGAVEKIKQKRQNEFNINYIDKLISEAKKLELSKEDIINLIESGF
ncbi:MAG: GntR family transcriptional regulator [Oscillospiraceae bacterium]